MAAPRKPRPSPEAVLLRPAAESAAGGRRAVGGTACQLAVEANDGERVFADADQLHRILVNLFRNARQAIEASHAPNGPGLIRLAAEHGDGATHLIVSDNGPGLPERAREGLFQPFAGSGKPGGSGLGLAISRELARGHGGESWNWWRAGPQGTRFALVMPDEPPAPPKFLP